MANYPLLGKYTSINPINKTRFICEVPKKNPIQPPKKDQNNLWLFNKHSYHPPPKKKSSGYDKHSYYMLLLIAT
jgi:hypothetical protein